MTDIPLIELVQPLHGFPSLRHFALVEVAEDGLLCALRSVEDPDVRFLVVPPAAFFPDYAPEIDDETAAGLEITSSEGVLLLVVIHAGDSLAESTANLAAPILINTATLRAQQVILDDAELSLAASLAPA
jgi:flagellar assembly factor FliW